MRTNVYGTTCRGNRIYLHVFERSLTNLKLQPLPLNIIKSYMLNGGKVQVSPGPDALNVEISANDMETPSTIIVLEVDGSAEDLAPFGEAPVNRNVSVRSSNEDASLGRMASDGNMCTYWKSDGQAEPPWLEFDLGTEKEVSRAILFEGWYQGEFANIDRFEIDVESGGAWKQVADVAAWGQGTPHENAFDNWPMAVFHQ